MKRIPTLDGWRGIAILLVICDHWGSRHTIGRYGVALFFVLSGYLISTRLTAEPDLNTFYVRRMLRLWPVAWAYLFVLAIAGSLTRADGLSCLFFYRNFLSNDSLTSHFWSLSVEEQFYLLWPAILVAGGRLSLLFALAGIVGFGFGVMWPYAGLLVGCVLAFAVEWDVVRSIVLKWHQYLFPASAIGFVFCSIHYTRMVPLIGLVCIASMLACTSLNNYRWLEWKPLSVIGVYSYSIYVWQEPLRGLGWVGLSLVPVVAYASYRFIEQPMRRLGRVSSNKPNTVPELTLK